MSMKKNKIMIVCKKQIIYMLIVCNKYDPSKSPTCMK